MTATLAIGPGAQAHRPRSLTVATALISAAVAALFMGVLTAYFVSRSAFSGKTAWIPAELHIRQVVLTMQTITLVMSCVTILWAGWAIRRDDRRSTYIALGTTFLLGLAHINGLAFVIKQFGVGITSSVPAAYLFIFAGMHIVMTVGALVYLGAVGVRTLGGNYGGRDAEGIDAATIFWFATVLMWVVIWALVLVGK